jgi:hypothetical protein
VYPVSHIEGRTRLKFPNLYEKSLFLENAKNIPGLKSLKHDDLALTILVKYESASPFDYVIKNIISKEPEPRLSKDDISSYVAPVLTNRITKALWLIAVLGVKVGFLQFSVSSMIVNRYIKARFG